MTRAPANSDRLSDLLAAYCDGSLTDQSGDELEALLGSSAENRRRYFEYVLLHGELAWELTRQNESAAPDEASGDALPKIKVELASLSRRKKKFDSIHWQRHKIRFNAMTAVLTALAWIGFSYFVWFSSTPDDSRPNRSDNIQYVAEITGQYEARWVDDLHQNTVLLLGERLNLVEGLIEITYYDGAKVVLEGPSEFVVDSSGAGTLEVGSLTATVPKQAIGFTVMAAGHEIIDRGTEFGVQVDPTDGVKVFVYQGRVDAHAMDPTTGKSHRYVIEAGEAMHLITDDGLSVQSIPIDELRLVRRLPRPFSRSPLSDQDRIDVVAYQYGEGDPPSLEPDRSDGDFTKLTDHRIGTDRWDDGGWVGVLDGPNRRVANYVDSERPQPRIDFELNETAALDLVVIHYLVDHEGGLHAPDRVVLSLSVDGEQFTEVMEEQGFDDTPDPPGQLGGSVREYRINLDQVTDPVVRFVRVDVYNDEYWTFLGEVAFYRSEVEDEARTAHRDR